MITFRTTSAADCRTLVANLRPQDRAEMQATRGGLTVEDLWDAAQEATQCFAAYLGGKLVCIFGVNPHPTEGVGVPWLLGTPLLDRYMISVCKQAKAILVDWHTAYPTLTNFTACRNTRILNWLRWLGFSFGDTVVLNGHTFIQFSKSV
jgi:hypothetical protein